MFGPTFSRFSSLPALAAGAALLLVAACSDAAPPQMEDAYLDGPAGIPPGGPMAGAMDGMLHATIALAPVDESGVSGESMAMHTDDAVSVSIGLEGLPGEGEYPAHIHSGRCADGGGVSAPLNPIIGTPDGVGRSTTTLDVDEVPADEPSFVQVHAAGGAPLACGDIAGHGD